MKSGERKLKLNSMNTAAFFNLLGPIILNGVNFFTIPIFTRMLGTDNYGIVSIYTTWMQIFTILMGIQTCGALANGRVSFKPEEQDAYRSSTLFLSCMTSAVVAAVMLVFLQPVSNFMELSPLIVVIMLLHSFGAYVINFASMKYIHTKQAHKNFILSVGVTVLTIVLSLLFLFRIQEMELRYWGRILGYALPNIVIGIVLAVVMLGKGKTLFNKKYWKFCLPLCLPLIFHGLSQTILGQSDRVMLQKIVQDDGIVGIYSFIFTLTHLLGVIWNALNNTWVPYYYEYERDNEVETIETRSKNYRFLFTILCMGFILVSPEVVRAFASEDYWSGMNLIPIMAASQYMVFLYSFPVNFEFFHRKTALIAIGTCCAGGLNILFNFLLIPRYGMMGAAVATLAAYFLLFVFHQIIARYVIKQPYHYPWRFFLPGIIAVAVTCVVFYLIFDHRLWRWGLGAILGLLLIRRVYANGSLF